MGRKTIFERRMTSAERSARNDAIKIQNYATFRDVMRKSAEAHLEAGRTLSEMGKRQVAHESLRMAEVTTNTIKILDYILADYEHIIMTPAELMRDNSNLPNPWNTTISEKMAELKKPEDKQATYAAQRAALRPITEKRFGHLAKAPKPDNAGASE